MFLVPLVVCIVVVEALTNLLVKSEFFSFFREFFFNRKDKKVFNFFYRLTDCGYCTSVWIAFFVSIFLYPGFGFDNKLIDWFISWITLHRASNILHFVIDRFNRNSDFHFSDKEI